MTRFSRLGFYVLVRAAAACSISLLLAGCMLDGFNLLPEFRASDAGATEPVPSLRTYRMGSNTQKDPLLYIRFVRVDANQYAMEQFAQDGNDAVFQAQHATFVPLDGAWHMLLWRDTRLQLQGVQLVRFGPNHMEVAEVSKFQAQIARLGPAAGTDVLKLLGGSGLTLSGITTQQLPGFLRAVVNLPGLNTIRLTATDSVPADIRNRAMQEKAPQFAALDARDAADPVRAQRMLNYFRVLHSEGIGLGTYAYARAAYQGWGMPRDTRMARELANQAVALGVARANTLLGVMALQGIDEPVNHTRALILYELAAKAGDGAAFTNLGFAYLRGEGVTKDAGRAAQWFERGAGENSTPAIVQLADMMLDGMGVAKDDKRAAELLDRAVGASHPHGTALRAWMYALGRGGPADQAKASELFLKAAQLGSGFGQWQIGSRLVEGIGVAANREQGMKWLAQASEAGVLEAQQALARLGQSALSRSPFQGATVVARLGSEAGSLRKGTHWLLESSVRRYGNTLVFDIARGSSGDDDTFFRFSRYWAHCGKPWVNIIGYAFGGSAKPGDVLSAYTDTSSDTQKSLNLPLFERTLHWDNLHWERFSTIMETYRSHLLAQFCSLPTASTQVQRVSIHTSRDRAGGTPQTDQLSLDSVVRQGSRVEGRIIRLPLLVKEVKDDGEPGGKRIDFFYSNEPTQSIWSVIAECASRELTIKGIEKIDATGAKSKSVDDRPDPKALKGGVWDIWVEALCQM